MGSVVGPDSSVIGFHGDGPVRRGFDNLTVITQRFGELDPGKMRAEAVVDTAAKRQHRGCAFPGDVEPAGVVVTAGSRLAAAVLAMTSEPAGNSTPPGSTSTTALRRTLKFTGEWRMSSSTACGANSGRLANSSHWSGRSAST
jgi:hypothetical protein